MRAVSSGRRRANSVIRRLARPDVLCIIGIVFLLVVAAAATAARSARLVEVRLGQYPTHTRVVFELDVAADYEIEQQTSPSGADVFLVSLEAAGAAAEIATDGDVIAGSVGSGPGRPGPVPTGDARLPGAVPLPTDRR